jgi:type IV secretory pathway component VirB8
MEDSVAIARLEEKMDRVLDHLDSQAKMNEHFYEVRDKVLALEARSSGAWFIMSLFGAITVATAGFVSWVMHTFLNKG